MSTGSTLLLILDGWGVREEAADNAIAKARTPNWDALWSACPRTTLSASGGDVGLPAGQMGNSEVGHMTLGAGRTILQDLTRIDQALHDGALASNQVLARVVDAVAGGTVHVLGLLSPGGVHSHEDHIATLLDDLEQRRGRIRLHAFLDGRDTPPKSAAESLDRFARRYPGVLASITGRYYAMDRDQRWERTERAYKAVADGDAPFHFESAEAALDAAYRRGETDEFVQPSVIHPANTDPSTIRPEDACIFMNFRADRARQLTRALLDADFDGFARPRRTGCAAFATLTHYADDIDAPALFGAPDISGTLGETLAARGIAQLRLAETEKYAHVTYFFSGGREEPFSGEERILVPSPRVATYDLAPAMSAAAVTDRLLDALRSGRFGCIVCNYANGDMVGHTGNLAAAVRAVETIDDCLGRIVAAVRDAGAQCLITADHGNVERMRDARRGEPHTAHTTEAVPLVYVGAKRAALRGQGTLADVAPTLLDLMAIEAPAAMRGRSLLVRQDESRAAGAETAAAPTA